jgi:hypothetical protein
MAINRLAFALVSVWFFFYANALLSVHCPANKILVSLRCRVHNSVDSVHRNQNKQINFVSRARTLLSEERENANAKLMRLHESQNLGENN